MHEDLMDKVLDLGTQHEFLDDSGCVVDTIESVVADKSKEELEKIVVSIYKEISF